MNKFSSEIVTMNAVATMCTSMCMCMCMCSSLSFSEGYQV